MIFTNRSEHKHEIIYEYKQDEVYFIEGQRGSKLLCVSGYTFVKNRASTDKIYWICSKKVR